MLSAEAEGYAASDSTADGRAHSVEGDKGDHSIGINDLLVGLAQSGYQ